MIELFMMGGEKQNAFYATFVPSGTDQIYLTASYVDASSNIYFTGGLIGGASVQFVVGKLNSTGVTQWIKILSYAGGAYPYGVKTDSGGNVYFVASAGSSGQSGALLTKMDSSGGMVWTRVISLRTGSGFKLDIDSGDNIYITGVANDLKTSSDTAGLIAKYNSSGTLVWHRYLSNGASNENYYGVCLDGNSNVYVTGVTDQSDSGDATLVKLDSSGNITWQKKFTSGTDVQLLRAATCYGSNIYVAGYHTTASGTDAILLKLDTSGSLLWQRRFGNNSATIFFADVAADDSGNIYVSGVGNASGSNDAIIVKYDSSGNLLWQRRIGSSSDEGFYSINSDGGSIIMAGNYRVSSFQRGMLFKLPNDGSLTGTYNGLTYASTSTNNTAAPWSMGTNGAAAISNTISTSSPTIGFDTTTTYTFTVTKI